MPPVVPLLTGADHNLHRPSKQTEEVGNDRSIWVTYDWKDRFDVEAALKQQAAITELVRDSDLVVNTTVLEQHLNDQLGTRQRRAQVIRLGTIWLSEAGLVLSRVVPPPAP